MIDNRNFSEDFFICPVCKNTLPLITTQLDENLDTSSEFVECTNCHSKYHKVGDSIDLVTQESQAKGDRLYYENTYINAKKDATHDDFVPEQWTAVWNDLHRPEGKVLLDKLGDIKNKTILCLGNGSTYKELLFAHLGANVIISDLSFAGILNAKAKFDMKNVPGNIEFHAVDAYQIPVKEASVDVIYGYGFVHHLPDVEVFLKEVYRVLKPNGMAIFYDSGYSVIWDGAKHTILWPFMKLSHWLYPRSPEDLRYTHAGGFREEELRSWINAAGSSKAFFHRTTLFQYLLWRGLGKTFGWRLFPKKVYRTASLIGRWLDLKITAHIPFLDKNRIEMVWGFLKSS